MTHLFSTRISKLQSQLHDNDIFVVSNRFDIVYLTGFKTLTPDQREAFLLITKNKVYLLLSFFSVHRDIPGVKQIQITRNNNLGDVCKDIRKKGQTIYIDEESLRLGEYNQLTEKVSSKYIQKQRLNFVTLYRMSKDKNEQKQIQQSCFIVSKALHTTIKKIQTGITEKEVLLLLEKEMREQGAEDIAFPTIVSFGQNTAFPHHQPTDRKLKNEEPIMIDCGCIYNNYCSDITRTMWFGTKPKKEFIKIKDTVRKAYNEVKQYYKKIKKGILHACDLDDAARNTIQKAGYGKQFPHTTGHGVGLYIHEQPSLNSSNTQRIKPNMTFTIEPGIYIEGKFGYRYENTVLTKEDDIVELTK